MFDRILVPLDGSDLAEIALPYAEELSSKLKAEVHLLRVVEYTAAGVVLREDNNILETVDQRYIDEVTRRLIKKGITTRSAVRVGIPADEIIEYANKENISIIVITAHGQSGIRQQGLGSTVDAVMSSADQPRLLLRTIEGRPDLHQKRLFRKMLIPLDGSKEAEVALSYAEELASKLEMEVILFQAIAEATHAVPVGGDGAFKYIPYTNKELETVVSTANDYLEMMARRIGYKGISTESVVIVGYAADEIIKFGDKTTADLIVMSMHNDEAYIYDALAAGASGYVVKSEMADLSQAIISVSDGEIYLTPPISLERIENYRRRTNRPPLGVLQLSD